MDTNQHDGSGLSPIRLHRVLLIVLMLWRAWVSAEQNAVLDHEAPTGITPGLRVFATTVLLLFGAAVYVGRTNWATFLADWRQATLGDLAFLVAVYAVWGVVIVWLLTKLFPPPTAVVPSPPQSEAERG